MSLSTAPLWAHTHVEGSAALSHGRAQLSSLAEEGGQEVCICVWSLVARPFYFCRAVILLLLFHVECRGRYPHRVLRIRRIHQLLFFWFVASVRAFWERTSWSTFPLPLMIHGRSLFFTFPVFFDISRFVNTTFHESCQFTSPSLSPRHMRSELASGRTVPIFIV